MMVTYVYMSVLIQQMTQTKYVGTIETLADVVNQNKIPLIYYKSSMIDVYRQSESYVKRTIANTHEGFQDDSEAVRLQINLMFAFSWLIYN